MSKILKYLYLFPIIIVCFFYSVDKSVLQSAVDGGLILGGFVNFPENFSNITSSNHNVYSTLIYFALILLKLNFSVDTISIILVFINWNGHFNNNKKLTVSVRLYPTVSGDGRIRFFRGKPFPQDTYPPSMIFTALDCPLRGFGRTRVPS